MKSRLRRAFSFGSAAELRRASAENSLSAERAKLRKDRYQSNEDAEQAAIIAKQEAAGIGAGIYSGQGGIGSTDNLSIQSAASSASIMLRKMGHGVKRGTKSIKGLFRPKSVIGVPAADGPVTRPSAAEVSRVTVEAERLKVNVNADPRDQVGGGTGYPRLERNSIDAGRTAEIVNPSISTNDSMSRKSIVGGDRERAEILSSMKKGILKRKYLVTFLLDTLLTIYAGTGTNSDSGSPVLKPVDIAPSTGVPRSNPGTPKHENGHIRNDDYFGKPPRIHNGSTRSLPTTPQGGLRNISFSPRIQFHDAWSPQDYDRRGDIATCNRLTPMLAQQIKEELNSFKMVRLTFTRLSKIFQLTESIGDGSPRTLQTPHPFLLMIMHPSFGHGVLANTFNVDLRIGTTSIYELQLNSMFWLPRTCYFYLSEHLQSGREELVPCVRSGSKRSSCIGRRRKIRSKFAFVASSDHFLFLRCVDLWSLFYLSMSVMGFISLFLTLAGVASSFTHFMSPTHRSRSAFCTS